jgi:hypothetical protein
MEATTMIRSPSFLLVLTLVLLTVACAAGGADTTTTDGAPVGDVDSSTGTGSSSGASAGTSSGTPSGTSSGGSPADGGIGGQTTDATQDGSTSPIGNGVYTLTCKTGGMTLDNTGSVSVGHAVSQSSLGLGNTNQQWRISSLGNGQYALVSLTSGMALDNGGSTTNGAAVTQNLASTSSANANQEWTITAAGGGYSTLVCASSGKALDNGGATSNGGMVSQQDLVAGDANQMWQLTPVQIGANTPFTSYEAEDGTLAGRAAVVSLTSAPTTEFTSPQLEASGRAYVNLAATGQSVTWTNNTGQSVNFINVRYSIPDAAGGGGIVSTIDLLVDGQFRQTLSVNSKQTWLYETASSYDGVAQDPSAGNPHVFWDETHAFIGAAPIAPGSKITLIKDAANTAGYYNIDVVDLEAAPPPLTQPANSLSITSYGAVADNNPTDGSGDPNAPDSTAAIQSCINDANSQGKSVWIPQGTFYLKSSNATGLTATGVTIEGAGMWYSTIYYSPPLPSGGTSNVMLPTSCTLKSFAIDGNAVSKGPGGGNGGGINIKGSNWLIDSVWVSHEGAGVWADGTGGTVQNCRLNNTWADGININNGNGGTNNNVGNNLTVKNNFIRGSGDDGLAINTGNDPGAVEMQNAALIDNTVVAPWWADNIGVYGGMNDLVANNLCMDSVKEYAINIGLFSGWAYLQSANIQGNTVLRSGDLGYGNHYTAVGIGVSGAPSTITSVTFCGNTINSTLFDGIDINTGTGLTVSGNVLSAIGATGIQILSGAGGGASLVCNTVQNAAAGQSAYVDKAGSGFSVSGTGNVGFTP